MARGVCAASAAALLSALAIGVHGQEILLEDAQAVGFSAATRSCNATGSGGGFRHNGGQFERTFAEGTEMTFFEYHFDVEKDGCYMVEEWHPADISGCGLDASALGRVPLRINYCKGYVARAQASQVKDGDQWNPVMQLPFYRGYPGTIAIHMDEKNYPSMTPICPGGRCLWLADAFRLTFLADTCGQADALARQAKAKVAEDVPPTTSELLEMELESAAPPRTVESVSVTSAAPLAAVQVVLSEPRLEADAGVFDFDPPYDGCYMVEEHHGHLTAKDSSQTRLEINYCKGLKSLHALSHGDGRHHQWNYVNLLPFFAGHRGSVEVPRRLLKKRHDHDFRITYVGPSCHARRARPHSAKIGITADFSIVPFIWQELAVFKTRLLKLLASGLQVHESRVRVVGLKQGSIIAELLVLPLTSESGIFAHADDVVDAGEAIQNLASALNSPGSRLSADLCALAKGDDDCSVSLLSSGPAAPLEVINDHADDTHAAPNSSPNLTAQLTLAVVAGLGLTFALAAAAIFTYWRCKKRSTDIPPIDVEVGSTLSGTAVSIEESTFTASKDLDIKNAMKDELASNASTATPDGGQNVDNVVTTASDTLADDKSVSSGDSGATVVVAKVRSS